MPYGSWVFVNFVVVAAFVAFVAPEVNFVVVVLHKLQAVRFVPAKREHIKADLATHAISEAIVSELFAEYLNKVTTDKVFLVVFFEGISLFSSAVATNGADINHTVTSLNVVACFYRYVKLVHVCLAEITEFIQALSPQKVFKRLLFSENSIF
jgi:hypothetical protein